MKDQETIKFRYYDNGNGAIVYTKNLSSLSGLPKKKPDFGLFVPFICALVNFCFGVLIFPNPDHWWPFAGFVYMSGLFLKLKTEETR